VSNPTPNEQKLVEILFQCVGTVSDPRYHETFSKMTHEKRMEWAAKQLSECGFPTTPLGASWGHLTSAP
jgi:hypothetical protein